MKKGMISAIVLTLLTTLLSAEALKNVPTLADANAYFEKWAYGDGADKPGYIVEFELPEKVWLDRKGYAKQGEEGIPGVLEKVTEHFPEYGTTDGAIVFMGGNGEEGEFPAQAGVCVSTDEAMGYGMMIAVMADKQDLFNKLARVASYYQCMKSEYDQLTSWVIPAKADGYYPKYQEMLDKVTKFAGDPFDDVKDDHGNIIDRKDIGEGWTYEAYDGWANYPTEVWGVPKKPKYLANGKIQGDDLIVLDANKGTVSGIAMDGALDIAFAYLMAHYKWASVGGNRSGEVNYLEMACGQFGQIIQVLTTYGKNGTAKDADRFMPLGTYNLLGSGSNGVTRPSDWLVTHLRAYFECVGETEARNYVGFLQDQMDDFAEEDDIADNINRLNPPTEDNPTPDGMGNPVANQPANTGFLPDFAEFDGKTHDLDMVTTSSVYEHHKENFYINVARFPFRQSLDYLMYGDEYSLARAIDAIKLPYAIYKANGSATNLKTAGNPFAADRRLDGTVESGGDWTNRLLQSAVFTTIFAADKAGITEYNDMYNAYLSTSIPDWADFRTFASQYITWQDSTEFKRTKAGQDDVYDTFEFKTDPGEHTGYFEDTWTLLAMYTMAEAWERPHGYPNEFEDIGTKWLAESESEQYVNISTDGDKVIATIKKDPGNESVYVVVEDFITKINSGYGFMLAIKRENAPEKVIIVDGKNVTVKETTSIDVDLFYPDVTDEFKNMKGEITIDEDNIMRGYMGHFNGVLSELKDRNGNKIEEQQRGKIRIDLNASDSGLKIGTKFTLTELGLYDPPTEVERYRYVDLWRSDEPYYLVGDYVSHNQETWQCIKEHDLYDENGNKIVPVIEPELGSEYWEISDYNLIGKKWESGTFYVDGDLVHYKGKTYIARVPLHSVNNPADASTVWMLYYDPLRNVATNWYDEGVYNVGELVHYNGNIYKCKYQHNAIASWTPVTAFTLWEKVNQLFTSIRPMPWETWTSYEVGARVVYDGVSYECTSTHTSQPGWDPVSVPALWK